MIQAIFAKPKKAIKIKFDDKFNLLISYLQRLIDFVFLKSYTQMPKVLFIAQ